jgi:hypothetical protein
VEKNQSLSMKPQAVSSNGFNIYKFRNGISTKATIRLRPSCNKAEWIIWKEAKDFHHPKESRRTKTKLRSR